MARKKKDEKSAERFTREEFESFQGLDSYDRSRLRDSVGVEVIEEQNVQKLEG